MSSRHLSWSQRVPIGDANGVKVYASTDFIRYYEQGRERMGGDTALTNIELAAAASTAQDAADAAALAASNAQTTANTANTTANALKSPQYITLSASADLTNERVLTQGANIVITDGGSGGAVTVALAADITGTAASMTIQPLAPAVASHGGTMSVKGQSATGTNKNGGKVVCQAGDGTGTGVGGQCSFYSGGGRTGGAINFIGGIGSVTGGAVNLAAGEGTTTGGSVNLSPGIGGTNPGSLFLNSSGGATSGVEVTDDNAGNTLVSLFGVTPVAQPTTAITGATFTANAGTAVNDASTFDGYTVKQVVKALRDLGILA